jgi:alkanesulfonate monooxygenase SsuD/methylene tetrahydromethanopterin reductase-like flavin-dependent oxidoreductase (luciferase family)
MLACSFVGAPATIERDLARFVERTGADELMVASAIYDHPARLRSYELLAGIYEPA